MFSDYIKLGIDHILDTNGYDHILFLACLCALYAPWQWKELLVLVTAFTIGHCATLALSALDVLFLAPSLVEVLIPVTIILTAMLNIVTVSRSFNVGHQMVWKYLLTLGFGFIHGLGFSNYFKAIIGENDSVLMPLFAFNIGVEIGQIVIVCFILVLAYLWMSVWKMSLKFWTIPISVVSIFVSFLLIFEKL
jgi:hypothetical protein